MIEARILIATPDTARVCMWIASSAIGMPTAEHPMRVFVIPHDGLYHDVALSDPLIMKFILQFGQMVVVETTEEIWVRGMDTSRVMEELRSVRAGALEGTVLSWTVIQVGFPIPIV